MIVEKYFYKTVVQFANLEGYTMKELAAVCETTTETLDKQLKRADGRELDGRYVRKLRAALAPNLTLDELYPEALKQAEINIQNHRRERELEKQSS